MLLASGTRLSHRRTPRMIFAWPPVMNVSMTRPRRDKV